MNTFVRCGSLFTGTEDEAQQGGALVFDEEGQLLYVGAEAGAPRRARSHSASRSIVGSKINSFPPPQSNAGPRWRNFTESSPAR